VDHVQRRIGVPDHQQGEREQFNQPVAADVGQDDHDSGMQRRPHQHRPEILPVVRDDGQVLIQHPP
jgi:hypothetical protein